MRDCLTSAGVGSFFLGDKGESGGDAPGVSRKRATNSSTMKGPRGLAGKF